MKENLDDTYIDMIDAVILVKLSAEPTILVQCEELELKMNGEYPYLYLKDISNQIEKKFGDDFILDVWYELGISGYIYRYNNFDKIWKEHGHTKGFA